MAGYPVPARRHRVAQEVRRSRFIATVARATDPEAALDFVQTVREEFPDASHHCHAFRAGGPEDSSRIGMSDAGEPKGTAGRPMLTVLLHAGVGDIAVVVTRYFGGTKLGTGGLVRAYGGAVQAALESLPTVPYQPATRCRLTLDYARLDPVARWLREHGGAVLESGFGARVDLTLSLPVTEETVFREMLADLGEHDPALTVLAREPSTP
mgnify:CR=1 FL=1